MKVKNFLKKYYLEIFVLIIGISFGTFLMFSTFSEKGNTIYISAKAWSDFASHIPLIRSFSLGSNFPPQYPLFPGEAIKYHFMFYAFVGILEKLGLRIDWALNLPSVIGFAALVFSIYFFAKQLFKSKAVGLLAVLFFLFSGSLAFLDFFKNHPLSINTIQDIVTNTKFSSFAPYDQGIVSAFWNLNIYTNQRHLAPSIAFFLIFIYFVLRPVIENKELKASHTIALGLSLGLFFFFHTAVFLMLILVLLGFFLLIPKLRKQVLLILIIGVLIALPQYLYLKSGKSPSGSGITFQPGYLISDNLTVLNFLHYWFFNLGLQLILFPLGFILAPRNAKKILICFLSIFIIGNLFRFTPDMPTNHKFFNVFMIVANMYSAYAIVIIWKKSIIGKAIVPILVFFLILSGIIDFFPIYNDQKYSIEDKKNPTVSWIIKNTEPDSIFLNSTYLYNPASIAGRKVLLGWPYVSWGAGYDSETRDKIRKEMLTSNNLENFCKLSEKISPDYAIINTVNVDENSTSNLFFFENNFNKLFEDKINGYVIFQLIGKCNL